MGRRFEIDPEKEREIKAIIEKNHRKDQFFTTIFVLCFLVFLFGVITLFLIDYQLSTSILIISIGLIPTVSMELYSRNH
jgi:hypothetical protein